MKNKKNRLKILVLMLLSIVIMPISIAEGNITTDNGNLYLQPFGGEVTVVGNISTNYLRITNSTNNPITHLYAEVIPTGAGGIKIIEEGTNGLTGYGRLWLKEGGQTSFTLAHSIQTRQAMYIVESDGSTNFRNQYGDLMFLSGYKDDDSDIILFPRWNGVVRPYQNKITDLGTSERSWKDCYCDEYHTTSRGYIGDGEIAFNAISLLETRNDGEINHSTVDASLKISDESISINSVTFANSKAISYLMERIEQLKKEQDDLRSRISQLEDE